MIMIPTIDYVMLFITENRVWQAQIRVLGHVFGSFSGRASEGDYTLDDFFVYFLASATRKRFK